MFIPKILFLDIDGTILKPDHTMSQRVSDAIHSVRGAGVSVVLSTGRSWEALKSFYTSLKLDGLTVCYNGAAVIENDRPVFEIKTDEEAARKAVTQSRSDGIELVVYRNAQLLCEKDGPFLQRYLTRTGLQPVFVNFDDFETLGLTKAIFFDQHDRLEQVKKTMESRFPPERLTTAYSDPEFLELMGGHTDKGRGVLEVCRITGTDPAHCAAIGDGWNDLAMLQAVGQGWLMGNASADLKAQFSQKDIITDSQNDGAAVVMEEIVRAAAQ